MNRQIISVFFFKQVMTLAGINFKMLDYVLEWRCKSLECSFVKGIFENEICPREM